MTEIQNRNRNYDIEKEIIYKIQMLGFRPDEIQSQIKIENSYIKTIFDRLMMAKLK